MASKRDIQGILEANVETFKLKVDKAKRDAPSVVDLFEKCLRAAERRLARHLGQTDEL